MNICKRALLIALRHPLYLVIYIGFLSTMGVLLMGEVSEDQTLALEPARTRIALVDRDGSDVSAGLAEALAKTDELVSVEDEPLELQDALACGRVDAVLIVPAGFGDELMAAAREARDLPELEIATGSDAQAAALAGQRASRWTSLVAAHAALESGADGAAAVNAALTTTNLEPTVEVLESNKESSAASRLAFYLTFSSYTLTSSVIVVAGVVLAALGEADVRRRQLASPVSSWRMGLGSIAGCGVLTLGVVAWIIAVGMANSGADALLPNAAPQVTLALVSFLVFSLVPLALAYTLAQCGFGEEALNAIANLGGMVMSFLGGAWVPLSLMGAGVQAVARFTPTFWMYDAVTHALGARTVTPQVLATVGVDLGIIALFVAAIVSVGLVVSRLRMREA